MYFFWILAEKAVFLHRNPDKFVDFDNRAGKISTTKKSLSMRRIEFIAPVEAMRGNLSGDQQLQYAANNNPAFDAPEGRQYARNYQPRYIGAKRASDTLKYFAVKTRTATRINSASLLRMALLGASGALYGAVIRNADVLAQAQGVYAYFRSVGLTNYTFRKWLQDNLRMMLSNKMISYTASASSSAGTFNLTIDNPWVMTSGEPNCPVSDETLVKFWPQLATDPVVFTVSGAKGVAHAGDSFNAIIASPYNILGLSVEVPDEDVKLGLMFVVFPDGSDDGINLQLQGSNPVTTAVDNKYLIQITKGRSQG